MRKKIVVYTLSLLLLLVFQNCQEFLPYQEPMQNQSSQDPNPTPQPLPIPMPPQPMPPLLNDPLCEGPKLANFPIWPNEDTRLKNYLNWGFDQIEGQGLVNAYPIPPEIVAKTDPAKLSHSIVNCTNAPVSPNSVLKNLRSKDGDGNGGIQIDYYAKSFDEVYIAIVWNANLGFEGSSAYLNRLFIAQTEDFNMFLIWHKGKIPSDDVFDEEFVVGVLGDPQINNCDLSPNDPGCFPGGVMLYPNNGPKKRAPKGVWHLSEMYIKKNTPGQKDGVIKWWLDGQLVGSYDRVNIGGKPITNISHQQGWTAHSPTDEPQASDWYFLIDHLRISGITAP